MEVLTTRVDSLETDNSSLRKRIQFLEKQSVKLKQIIIKGRVRIVPSKSTPKTNGSESSTKKQQSELQINSIELPIPVATSQVDGVVTPPALSTSSLCSVQPKDDGNQAASISSPNQEIMPQTNDSLDPKRQRITAPKKPLEKATTATVKEKTHNSKEKLCKAFENVAGVACEEVVRGKCKRQDLPGHTCRECEKFYEAIDKSHFTKSQQQQLVQDCSRHRHRFLPPATPPGYWSLPSLTTPKKKQKTLYKGSTSK